ncbi:TPA: hypothetical protein U5E11_004102 [Yersinia enterocolitica]|nr:hypothetical protein [Yersinia enterocolitica]
MAIFMELRCELRGEGRCEFSGTRCWSDDNNGPSLTCYDTKKSAANGVDSLAYQAKNAGWEKRKEGWVCPNCLKHEAKLVEGNADGNS